MAMSEKEQLLKLRDSLIKINEQLLREVFDKKKQFAAMKNIRKCVPRIQEEDELSSEPQDIKKLKKCLNLTSSTTGIIFKHVSVKTSKSNSKLYEGIGKTIVCDFICKMKLKKQYDIMSIEINFANEDLEKELGPWKREYSRKRDFQALMRGISKYSELMSQMNKILKSSIHDYMNLMFDVTVGVTGCMSQAKMTHDDLKVPVLTIHWKIMWKECVKTMADSFIFEIADVDLFPSQDRLLWAECTKKNIFSIQDIRNLWVSVFDSVNKCCTSV